MSNLPPVANLSHEEKRTLLATLARDLLGPQRSPLSIDDPAGEVMIYMAPPDARERAIQTIRERRPEQLAELQRRAADWKNSISVEEALRLTDEPDPDTRR